MSSAARPASGKLRVLAGNHQRSRIVVVPGDLPHECPAGGQAGRHDRGRRDDLGRAERPVQVLRALPGRAEYPLQGLAARGGILFYQRVEQVKGIVAVERP